MSGRFLLWIAAVAVALVPLFAAAQEQTPAPKSDDPAPCWEDMCSVCARVGDRETVKSCTALLDDAKTSEDYRLSAYGERAIALTSLKRFAEAVDDLSRGLDILGKMKPDRGVYRSVTENYHLLRGIAFYGLRRYADAIADFHLSSEYEPEGRLPNMTAMAYWHLNQGVQALKIADAVIGDGPEDHVDYYCRGLIRNSLGNKAGALQDFGKAVELARQDFAQYRSPEVLQLLTKALYQRGLLRRLSGDSVGGDADIKEAKALSFDYAKPDIYSE